MKRIDNTISANARLAANQTARKAGYNKATHIILGADSDKVISVTSFGYRKYSDGSYVSSSYRSNFGWKNTYYQEAIVVVQVCFNH